MKAEKNEMNARKLEFAIDLKLTEAHDLYVEGKPFENLITEIKRLEKRLEQARHAEN